MLVCFKFEKIFDLPFLWKECTTHWSHEDQAINTADRIKHHKEHVLTLLLLQLKANKRVQLDMQLDTH